VNTDITAMLRLNDWGGRVVLVFYGIGTTLIALINLSGLLVPGLGIITLVLLWAGLAILATPGPEPFPLRSTVLVIVIVAVGTSLSAWNVADVATAGYATWHLGALTFLLLVLALRGRRMLAWIGFATLAVISLICGIVAQQDLLIVVNDVVRQSATLMIGTLFALVLRRASQTITAIQNNQLTRATIAAATMAATRERASQNARLEQDARPALERILAGKALGDDEQRNFALLEATLRDGIRATGFSSERIAIAAREAREQGLRVVLLDDRGSELVDGERELVEAALLDQLRATSEGAITARLSPEDRDELATIVVEEGGVYRRVVVTHSAVEITHL
jgi:hypothetical protein